MSESPPILPFLSIHAAISLLAYFTAPTMCSSKIPKLFVCASKTVQVKFLCQGSMGFFSIHFEELSIILCQILTPLFSLRLSREKVHVCKISIYF